jgi:hypothetical protein
MRLLPEGIPARVLAAAMVVLSPTVAAAAPVVIDGVTFSDELGGLDIERVTGHGSNDDPFVVVEHLTNPDGATLLIRAPPGFGNRIGSVHAIGLALVKVVENATDFAWTSFDLELQSRRGVPSDYADGLSFGQGSTAGRPFTALGFGRVEVVDEPYDQIDLSEGKIPIGSRMTARFVVTESVPLADVYLVQRPIRPIARWIGPPSPTRLRPGGALAAADQCTSRATIATTATIRISQPTIGDPRAP